MGLLILPFILAAFVITIVSAVIVVKLVIRKQIGVKDFLLGILTSLVIYGIIILCYKIAGSAWALSTGFIMPICLFVMPFGAYFIAKSLKNKYLSSALIISIVCSGILATSFYEAYFEFFEYIGIEKLY